MKICHCPVSKNEKICDCLDFSFSLKTLRETFLKKMSKNKYISIEKNSNYIIIIKKDIYIFLLTKNAKKRFDYWRSRRSINSYKDVIPSIWIWDVKIIIPLLKKMCRCFQVSTSCIYNINSKLWRCFFTAFLWFQVLDFK